MANNDPRPEYSSDPEVRQNGNRGVTPTTPHTTSVQPSTKEK